MSKKNEQEQPNLIFVGLKINRHPIEEFRDGELITLPKADEQTKVVKIKIKNGEREELQAVPFFHQQAARIVRVLGSRLYQIFEPKTPTK